MNDFLGNLAAKNLNAAPLLEPRPLALFEASPSLRGNAFASPNLDAPLEISAERETEPVAPRVREHAIQPTARQEPGIRESAAIRDYPQLRAQDLNSIATPPRMAQPQIVSSEIPALPQTQTRHAELETQETTSPQIARATPTEILRVERVIIEREQDATNTLSRESGPALSPAQPAASRTPDSARVTTEREPRAIPSVAPTPLAPMLSAQVVTPRVTTAPKEPAPPTIHVTIGRVEVRAMTNAPRPKSAPVAASRTLEEYLRGSERR